MSKKTKALLAVMAGNGIFGFSFLFSKIALDITIPSVLIAVRFTTAFLILNIIVFAGKHIRKKDGTPLISFSLRGKPLKQVLLLALFQPVIYFIAENYGIVYTSSSFAGIIIAVIPIAGIIFDVVIFRSRVKAKQIICALASVTGVAVTTIGAKDMSSSVKGLALLLVAVVAGAMFYVFSIRASKNYSPIERTYVMFGVGTIVYIIIAAVQCYGNYEKYVTTAVTAPAFWMAILYLAVVSSVAAFLLLNYGSDYVSVSQATIFANFTTVISIVAGIVVLGESFTWQQGAGAAVILISVYFASI